MTAVDAKARRARPLLPGSGDHRPSQSSNGRGVSCRATDDQVSDEVLDTDTDIDTAQSGLLSWGMRVLRPRARPIGQGFIMSAGSWSPTFTFDSAAREVVRSIPGRRMRCSL